MSTRRARHRRSSLPNTTLREFFLPVFSSFFFGTFLTAVSPEEYKKLLRKIDLFLMPLLMIAYGLQYIDKTSLSSGAIFGLKEETHLKGNEYANLTLFFCRFNGEPPVFRNTDISDMAYFFAQIPMSWILQKLPFGRTLSICVIIWGGCVMCLAACGNYSQLVAVRFLIGWFESVVTPAFAILTTSWYLRNEQTLRQGIYYSMSKSRAVDERATQCHCVCSPTTFSCNGT